MSNPMPNRPQTMIRLIVVGVKSRCGRMNGAAISPNAVSTSTTKGLCLRIKRSRSFAAGCSEQAVWTKHQHQRHGHEQHDVGITRIEHRRYANDLAGDEAA